MVSPRSNERLIQMINSSMVNSRNEYLNNIRNN